jgi:hypothetical protein
MPYGRHGCAFSSAKTSVSANSVSVAVRAAKAELTAARCHVATACFVPGSGLACVHMCALAVNCVASLGWDFYSPPDL